jgi:hypothetical protein
MRPRLGRTRREAAPARDSAVPPPAL